MSQKLQSNPAKTVLTISVGFAVIFLITKIKWFLYISLGIGIAGALSDFLAQKIEWLWFGLSKVLSMIVPNIILSVIFYVFLFPVSVLQKVFGKSDPLMLKRNSTSYFKDTTNHADKASFEKPW